MYICEELLLIIHELLKIISNTRLQLYKIYLHDRSSIFSKDSWELKLMAENWCLRIEKIKFIFPSIRSFFIIFLFTFFLIFNGGILLKCLRQNTIFRYSLQHNLKLILHSKNVYSAHFHAQWSLNSLNSLFTFRVSTSSMSYWRVKFVYFLVFLVTQYEKNN